MGRIPSVRSGPRSHGSVARMGLSPASVSSVISELSLSEEAGQEVAKMQRRCPLCGVLREEDEFISFCCIRCDDMIAEAELDLRGD